MYSKDMAEAACFPRASLFLACRLASIVQKFKHRLQAKVQFKKKSPNPFGNTYHRGIRLRALSDLERCAPQTRLTITDEPRSAVEHQGHGKWVTEVLRDLHKHTNSPTFSLTRVAADDKLLLSHAEDSVFETLTQNATLPQVAYLFDSATFLIGRLEALLLEKAREWAEIDADCKRLKEESYIANLLHLLRRLQHVLFQVLVHRSITHLDEFAQHWQTYWQQQKKLGEDWFTEWPSGQRPLSTTWPWNIRPSLVVLWGVCWMFYTPEQNNDEQPPRSPVAQQLVDESVNWTPEFLEAMGQAPHVGLAIDTNLHTRTARAHPSSPLASGIITTTMQAAMMGRASPSLNVVRQPLSAVVAQPHSHISSSTRTIASPGSQGPGSPFPPGISHISSPRLDVPVPVQHAGQRLQSSSPFLSTTLYHQPVSRPLYNTSVESRDLIGWPGSIGGDHSSPSISREQVPSNVWPGSDTPASPIHYPTQTSIPTVAVSAVERQFNTEGLYPPYQYPPFGHNPDMGGLDNYPPSPQSDQGRQPSITTPTSLPGSVNVDHITTPGSDGSKGVQMSVKRGDPPRNAEKQIYCNHSECAGDPPTFRRPSDWNKHMDKHERPYKCCEPGCDKIQGFTYSGGLLRHQREVHKMNQSTGRELFCQFENCNRSISQPNAQPFTRQENLKEHIRRRHVAEGTITSPSPVSVMSTPTIPPRPSQEPSRKRKRSMSNDFDDELQYRTDTSDEDAQLVQVKRLKKTIVQRDNRINQLSDRVRQLEKQLAALKEHVARAQSTVGR